MRRPWLGRRFGRMLYLAGAAWLMACSDPNLELGVPDQVTVHRKLSGDTVVTTSSGWAPTVRIGEEDITIPWDSPHFQDPRSMVLLDSILVVLDVSQLHFVNLHHGAASSVGRWGQGPGEFHDLVAVTVVSGDTVVAYDASLARLNYLDLRGRVLRTVRLSTTSPYPNARRTMGRRDPILLRSGKILLLRQENMQTLRAVRTALIEQDLVTGDETILRSWDDVRVKEFPSGLVSAEVFAPGFLIDFSPAGEIAFGDGRDYCSVIHTWASGGQLSAGAEKVCRRWDRIRPGSGIVRPDLTGLRGEDQRRLVAEIVSVQEVPDLLSSFDALMFDGLGNLWFRTVGRELAEVHPSVRSRVPEAGPEFRRWDVFNSNRELVRTVELPSSFVPQVIDRDFLLGFYFMKSGERVVAQTRLPP